jgi:hypothetical protein
MKWLGEDPLVRDADLPEPPNQNLAVSPFIVRIGGRLG